MAETLSAAQARRIALAAQGFGRAAPASIGTRQLNQTIRRLGLLQLDSVNVFERSHYLPLYARLGHYDKAQLDRLVFSPRGSYIEYWAHQAALIPMESWPLWRWRMQRFREKEGREWLAGHRSLADWLLDELRGNGPMRASAIEHDANERRGSWWGHSDVKRALEIMFLHGEVATGGRTSFERTYALPEQVLPVDILERTVPRDEAQRQLVEHAAGSYGIATARDLADYYRMRRDETMAAIRSLVDSGVLLPVTVRGWDETAYLHRDARIPRRLETTAVLSPFDPVVWERTRAERMFGFHYRIEIYTPAPKRVFGYYSLPILIDDALVGRIDLKSDRQAGILRVQSAWHEHAVRPEGIADRLPELLRRTAAWQGLDGIEVMERGNLSPAIAAVLGQRARRPA